MMLVLVLVSSGGVGGRGGSCCVVLAGSANYLRGQSALQVAPSRELHNGIAAALQHPFPSPQLKLGLLWISISSTF